MKLPIWAKLVIPPLMSNILRNQNTWSHILTVFRHSEITKILYHTSWPCSDTLKWAKWALVGILPPLLYFHSAGFSSLLFHLVEFMLSCQCYGLEGGSNKNKRFRGITFKKVYLGQEKKERHNFKRFQGISFQGVDDRLRRCTLHQDWSPGGIDMILSRDICLYIKYFFTFHRYF